MLEEMIQQGPFNLFVGAGVSKLPPAYAPLWREMLHDFVESLFSRMENENWPASDAFAQDKPLLWNFNFRPESFWQIILRETSIDLVCRVFQVLQTGRPNLNHRLIAELLSQGLVANLVTTNFDEYIDMELPPSIRRIATDADLMHVLDENKEPTLTGCYFKVHGTISVPETLEFTLDHTSQLSTGKAKCLEACLLSRPLLIAGYSGNDDDIMPQLQKIVQKLPAVKIIVLPNMTQDEPIRELARHSKTVTVVESDLNSEFRGWTESEVEKGNLPKSILVDRPTKAPVAMAFYEKAVARVPIVLIPLVVSSLFEFTGNIEAALRYANLADDACVDRRYSNMVSGSTRGKVRRQLSLYYGMVGDADMSRGFATRARKASEAQGSIAENLDQELQRVFGLLCQERLSEQEEREVETVVCASYRMTRLGLIHGYVTFRSCWYLGRLRDKQGRREEAVAAYREAIPDPIFLESMDHVTRGCFLLDFGTALFHYSLERQDVEALNEARKLFHIAADLASKIGDHLTLTQVSMNLSRVYYIGGKMELARQKLADAEKHAALTGNHGLQARVAQLAAAICGNGDSPVGVD